MRTEIKEYTLESGRKYYEVSIVDKSSDYNLCKKGTQEAGEFGYYFSSIYLPYKFRWLFWARLMMYRYCNKRYKENQDNKIISVKQIN